MIPNDQERPAMKATFQNASDPSEHLTAPAQPAPKFVVEVQVPGLSACWFADADQVKRLAKFTSDLILEAQQTSPEQ